ncbi:DUF5691 domain-containing protein [Actinokineospora enzanensis]|uniref:DUF5691 domain-containing protein n=1 Tax=Actinokineospora enzanensis TaxID=155975 RepID=UPI00037F7412|nr:DUF5691 domain-containing protein [Actinokineospora enzanensis]
MSAWEDVVGAALLGTRRRVPNPAQLPEEVRQAVATRDDPAEQVLVAAVLLAAARRAGQVARTDLTPLPRAAADPRPVVPSAARERLARLLAENRPEVLREWLEAVTAAGFRVPPERVPALADAAGSRILLREPLAAAAGPVGGWLGARNPEWAFLASPVPDDDTDLWQYGSLVQRRAWFTRALTTDPDAARAALGSTWDSEPADVRSAFLDLLAPRIRPTDEEFLERALDDRAGSVRQRAAEILAGLPDSALGARMVERMLPLAGLRGKTLVINLPTDDAPRDGLRAPSSGERRTAILRQLVAATPLRFWDTFGTPAEVAARKVDGVAPSVLRESLVQATLRQRDPAWARALLAVNPAGHEAGALVGALPAADRAEAVAALLTGLDTETAAYLARELPAPWPPDLGDVLLDWIGAQGDKRHVAHAAAVIAETVPHACLRHPVALARPSAEAPHWRRGLAETLAFRRAMYEELTDLPTR